MSDSQVSTGVLEQPSDNGQVGRANEPQDLGASGGRPSDNGQVAQDENIRKLQSTYDKKIAEERKTFQQQQQYANQQIAAMQQRLAQMEEASAPDDYARMELRVKRAEQERDQYAQAYQQTLQEKQAERAKHEALDRIADRYGVSRDDLLKAEDYESAVELAIETREKRKAKQQANDNDRRERNAPDTGGGAPSTATGKWEDEYQAAFERKDSATMARLLRTRGKT